MLRTLRLAHTFIPAVALCLLGFTAPLTTQAETLNEVLGSKELRALAKDTYRNQKQESIATGIDQRFMVGIDPQSEYARLWINERGGEQLFNWLGVNLHGFSISGQRLRRQPEFVQAGLAWKNREGRTVKLDILVPHPTYHTMVQYKTLSEFNSFEPPALETVAAEELSFSEVKGMYYRTPNGRCSILIKVEKLSIVNLSVESCEESKIMTDIIDSLTFKRLNQKLNS
jgi:hypothetical protein